MNRIFLVLIFACSFVFAQVDANLEIVKKAKTLPKILVSIASDTNEISTLTKIKILYQKT